MLEKNYLTEEGMVILKEKFAKARSEMSELSTTIGEIILQGNLQENQGYIMARDQQEQLERSLTDLSEKISLSVIVNKKDVIKDGKVRFLSTVEIEDIETEEVFTYTIVGETESDIKGKKISYKSPLGVALMGYGVGDVVGFLVMKNIKEFEILNVS
jgi:transcription elongation factor GreA